MLAMTPQQNLGEATPDKEAAQLAHFSRHFANYFEKFEQYEGQELLTYTATHWMLSLEDFRLPTEPPTGLISNANPLNSNQCVILIPEDPSATPLDYRELHQLIRELTQGIYVFNQTPLISLEPNFDQSTSCHLPPAYIDTKIGQILIDVDYMMKGLWHGAFFPKEKRKKFCDRWRSSLEVNMHGKPESKKNLLTEFLNSGMVEVTSDAAFADVYANISSQPKDSRSAKHRQIFLQFCDNITMKMTFSQTSVRQFGDLFVVDADWTVSTSVHLLDDRLEPYAYEQLNTHLQLHQDAVRDGLCRSALLRHHLLLLKTVSFLTTLLVGMRKRMKIPDMTKFLLPLIGDEVHTDRELPPLIVGPDFVCRNFNFGFNQYFHLHGGITFDLETSPATRPSPSITSAYAALVDDSIAHLNKMMNTNHPSHDHYSIPLREFAGQRYYVIRIEFETYYPQAPQKPLWVRSYQEEMARLKPKKLPVNEANIQEVFKKHFGYKKAMKFKTLMYGLKSAASRGLVAIFQALCRKAPVNRIVKQDDMGYTVLHYAAMNNRPQVIAALLLQSVDVNIRRHHRMSTGTTALHLAAQCGALDALTCLIGNYANILVNDHNGWTPIHRAALFDQSAIVRFLIRKRNELMEVTTTDSSKATPLLLAARTGGLMTVKTLIEHGACVTACDSDGNNVVNVAALHLHTNILQFLIDWNNAQLPVWNLLVKMLGSDNYSHQENSAKCFEELSLSNPEHWKPILSAGGAVALLRLLQNDNEVLQSTATSVMCNISEHAEVQRTLTEANAGPILVALLGSPVDDIQSRVSVILSDLASIESNQKSLVQHGAIPALIHLLDSELEDVLLNAVNAIRVLCLDHPENQSAVVQGGGVEPLIEFLTLQSDMGVLHSAAAAAIAAITMEHHDNQNAVMAAGAGQALTDLLRSRNVAVQAKVSRAVEALAENNPHSQQIFLETGTPRALLHLLKNINDKVKEQGACSLWMLAGHTRLQQKKIAEEIGISNVIEMLLEKTSEKLLLVGCLSAIALTKEDFEFQDRLVDAGVLQQLVRLLRRQNISDQVLLMVIRVLGTLCVGVAYRNNRLSQKKIAEEGTIPVLVQLLSDPPSNEIWVEVATTLACIVLCNHDNQEQLLDQPEFSWANMLEHLQCPSQEIRLRLGMALAIFSYNNIPQQFAIRQAGGISFKIFEEFIDSPDDHFQCFAGFQIVVLARVILDKDPVWLTACGVSLLISRLCMDDDVVVLAASLLSSLAHTRAGIPDAMLTSGALELLTNRLASPNSQVQNAVAITLGYLTFNKTAARRLFTRCRNTPGLYDLLIKNIGKDPKISLSFVDDFRRARLLGLPSQCLEINGGPPVIPPGSRNSRQRPITTETGPRRAALQTSARPQTAVTARRELAPSLDAAGRTHTHPAFPGRKRTKKTCV